MDLEKPILTSSDTAEVTEACHLAVAVGRQSRWWKRRGLLRKTTPRAHAIQRMLSRFELVSSFHSDTCIAREEQSAWADCGCIRGEAMLS